MEPDVLHTHRTGGRPLSKPRSPVAPKPPRALGQGLQKAAQGGLSTLYLHLLSLRVGLLGWYFSLKQAQWNLLCWAHTSLELATDIFFGWVQNALVACVMLLLLAWKVCSVAKALEAALRPALSAVKGCFWQAVRTACAPAFCAVWVTGGFVRLLEASYEQAAKMAREDDDEEGDEGEPPTSSTAAALPPPPSPQAPH